MASKFMELSIHGKLYFLWILCIVKLSKGTSVTLTCAEGWVLSGTMCYRLYGQDTLTSSTWDNAYRVCKGNGAELVTIDDYFTNQNVGDFVSARNTNKFWTGMSEKGVTTQNGIAMTWNMIVAASIYQGQWSVRNPDKAHGDCVYVEKKDGEYVWTIGSCLMKMAFVCQRTSCLPQSFHCDNGRCVNSSWRCDGVDDCGDLSDEVECAGRCSYLLDTASSGRIQSPNNPSNYLPSRVCTWTIVGPEGSNIYLEFTSFNTEKDTDIVEVLIGGRTESTARSVARLSGQPSLSMARYRSYNNYMIIRFSTDSQTEKAGFTATYNSSRDSYPRELYMTARTTVSTLEPPLFNSHGRNAYLGNRDYVWIIRAEERWKIVTLERMKIDLMGDDVIEIRDGDSGSAPLLEKYMASNNDNVDLPLSQSEPVMGKRFVFSTSNVMYIIMRTSGSTSGTGFSFQYKQGCIARYTADAGEITSPGYPNVNYANFQTCTWTIDIPSGKGVKVMLDRSSGFEIADNEDFIQVYTGTTDDSGNAAHGSGAGFTTISLSNNQPFHSPNGKMFIRFRSTAIINKKGFRLRYSIDCPDPGLTEASEFNPSQTAVQLRQFDNEFTVSCKNGYSFQSDELNLRSARMKCMYGGKWLVEQRTRTIPQCKPNYCGEPMAIDNGYISKSNGVVFGSFVTFTCFPGFTLLGSANITCQSTQWTSRPQCVSANCPAPPTISNGQLSSTNNQYAAIVNYTCNAGYQLIGAPILFCQSSGQWTASAPQCIKITCPIPEIKNGRVSSSTLPQFQETLIVSCDVGYIVNGSATITCGDDRNFDAVPNCITEVCPIKSLRPVLYADISCEWIGENATCTYSCKSGYVYYDGTTSKDYHCSGANNWSPSANPEECLLYETLSYKAKFEVHSSTTDIQASNCITAFENMLAAYNTTIAKAIDDRCKDLNPGNFVIRSFSSKTLFFKITTVIRGEFIGDGQDSSRETCISFITIISPSFILPVSSITCSDNQQATLTVEDIGNREVGNKCSDNMVLVNNQICVQCPSGRYFNGTTCVMCSEGQYQNLPGQSSCKLCDENTVSSVDKTTCIAKNCSLENRSGKWVVSDNEIEKFYKSSLESCKTGCKEDVKCNAMFYENGFCLIVYTKNPTVSPYTGSSVYFDKVCNHTYDINKCNSNNGGCSQLCINSFGSYTCSCNQPGYVLFDVDGRSGYTIQSPDDGNKAGDVYHLGHSCVRRNCSEPAMVNNAMLMTKRAMHRYMDKITYMCDLGYVKFRGDVTFTCGLDGQWTPSQTTNLLECSVATCPVSDLNTLNLKNRPTLSTTNPVSYLDYLNMTCDVPGKGTFVNQQQCLYAKKTNTYALYGAPYECEVIDCGNPVQVPGSSYSTTPSSTIYGATFTFTCENLQTWKGSSSMTSDNSVTCMADGNWDFGSLRCEGTTCTDPGYPNGGYLSTDVTGFEQDKVVTFGCNLAGFTVPANSALKCVLNAAADGLRWNGTTPTECKDTTAPVVSGCPENMDLGRYTVITHNRPRVSDNSAGIKTFEVSPRNANTTLVLEETPITITYTATDFNGNQDSCSFTVNVADEEPPKVTCPSAKTETVIYAEVRTFTLNPAEIVSSDNSGQAPTVDISPQSLTISASFIGTTSEITVTVRDSMGRTDQCRVQVYTAAAACSPHSLEKPLNGQKNCSVTHSGFRCDLKCDQTYTFYDTPGLDVKTLECSNGGAWPQRIPACTPQTQEALYTSLITVNYGIETSGQTIGSNCFDSTYKSVLSSQTSQTELSLKQGCSGGLFPNENIFIDIDEESSFAPSAVTTTSTTLSIIYTVKQTPLVYTESQYSSCSAIIVNRMQNFDISISKIQSTVGGCPNLVRTNAFENSKGFICSSEKKKVTVGGKDYCLDCPAGTYLSAPNTCDLCPVNTYKGNSGSSACTQCGSLGTQWTGSTSQRQCQAKCSAGTFSTTGMPPCNQCPKNTYWSSSTGCTACPSDGKTRSAGAASVASCINKCSAGSYSYDGYAPCRSCPKNYYQDQIGATNCTRCPNTQYTASTGSSASSSCLNALGLCSGLNCLNGGTCVVQDNEAICNCPIGYYGSRCENKVNYCIQGACYNGGTCVSGATSYTCTCPQGTTGSRCETDATDDCATAPCKNGGMCVNQLYNYRCLCTLGYTETTCSSQTSKCNEQPCNSVGTAECVNYDNIRRICKCKAGYTGQDCETNINDCASNPCLYGGTCIDLVTGYSCTCPTGYQGARCQNRVNPCSLNGCSNGQCVDAYSMDLFMCICQPGYQYGLICPYEMNNGNGTSLIPFYTRDISTITNCRQQCDHLQSCQAFTFAAGTCKFYQTIPPDSTITNAAGSTLNIKKCLYPDDDYWSPWYDQGPPNGGKEVEKRVQLSTYGVNVCNGTEPIDAECRVVGSKAPSSGTGDNLSMPCGVEGLECTDQVNNPCEDYEVRYKCAVHKGFQSNTCNLKNHCLSNPCMNGGICNYRFNDFACSCPTGYTGKLCQHDFDSCQPNPCLQGGTCIDKPGTQGYECRCPAGYEGSICQSNINECSPYPCDPIGSLQCRDAVNDYVCDCKPGYTGKNCAIEINECDAEPCMHGGNCTDRVNDFQCTCPEGWTGKQCEMIYDECTVNNKCPSSSQCLNIFKKSYCKCPKNTYGEVCENSPDICRDLRPCLNSAMCTAGVNELSKCTCPNDYRGVGCEIMVNHCGDPNKCENGGTCVNLAPGFRCDCPPGYSGANCSINVNECTNNCPSTSTCIDMVNAHYCRCPLGKTGESCVRDLDTNYDLYFYPTSQDGYAALPYPIYLSGSSFSLTIWVRFYHSSLTGTFLTIFIAKSANSLAGVTKFLSLDHEGLVVYDKNGQNPQRAAYQQQTVTDGQWNYVVVSWNKDNGFDLVVNSVRQSQIPTTTYTTMMAENIWVTLGADFDNTIMPKANDSFQGYLSQLNIYNRGLSFENEMPQLIPDPRKVFSGSILRWNEFVYHRGVQPVYPSSPQKPCTGENCLAYNKKIPVFKKPCPSNVYKVSADRLTSVTWTEPIPEGATIQESTFKSGETFLWGKYTNTYVIRDEENTSNFCSFNIYVMREQCPNPDPPHQGTRACERGYNPYFGCTIGCTNANRRIDRYTPKVYTCGPSGAWNPSNRNVPLRFPSCGLVQSQARRRLMMELAYPNFSATFCDTLALKLREAFTSVNTKWSNQICGQPDCSDMTVTVNCQTTPTSVKMIIPTSMAILTRSSPAETLTVQEILIRNVLESQLFDFSTTIPNGSPDLNSFTIDSSESCPTRQSVVDGYCVKCGPGNFFNSSSLVCEDCPVGTYQDQDDQTTCPPCPQGYTTQTVASPSSSDCKPICSPGHYQTGSRCDPCGMGFYQSQSGMFYCDPCPVGQTTRGDSSTSESECNASSSVTKKQCECEDNETVTDYYIIALSCMGMIIILLVTIVLILVRRHIKLAKEMHSLHYVKTIDSSALQQIDANDGTQYQELEENHYHYLTPGYENSQL